MRITPAQLGWQRTDATHPWTGKIWSVEQAAFIPWSELRAQLSEAQVVLIGESHDNAEHHRVQAMLIAQMAAEPGRTAVVLEMVERAQQELLDSARRQDPGDVQQLRIALDWDASGWPAFESYAPIFSVALKQDLAMFGAGLGRSRAMPLMRQGLGVLDPELTHRQGLEQALPSALHQALLEVLDEGHCGMVPTAHLEGMLRVQRVRDAMMADALEASVRQPGAASRVALVAGRGHIRKDWGVPRYLARRNIRSLSIALYNPATLAAPPSGTQPPVLPYDLLIFTPGVAPQDHCAQFKGRSGSSAAPDDVVPQPATSASRT